MEDKRPIDKKRESGGYIDVGTKEDGAIVEMKNIGGRLIIIKERSIYEMVMADTVDPERTNIHLPPMIHKLIINKGADSETVSRTFLTAKTLFSPEFISNTINCDELLSLTIDMLSEISIFENEIIDYQEAEKKVIDEYEERRNQKVSYKLPSIISLESRCKTIFQKADHIEQILMEIITRFYPNQGLTKQSHFPKFHEILKEKYGDTDPFTQFINKTLFFMRVVRELRNGFDHRLEIAKVTDFELQTDGNIISPTIELKHKDINLERTSLSEFLKISFANSLDIIELSFAYLAGYNVRTGGLPYQIRIIPEDKRQNKFIKYCFWTPIGKEGFYNQ